MKGKLGIMFSIMSALAMLIPGTAMALPDSTTTTAVDLVAHQALIVNAPQTGVVEEKLKVQVVEKYGGRPVAKVEVWGLGQKLTATTNTAASLTAITPDSNTSFEVYLGSTDENGIVVYAFKDSAFYYLIAEKDGYAPGLDRITIKPNQKALGIKVPDRALIGELVTMSVYELSTARPVPEASMWALIVTDTTTTSNTEDCAVMAQRQGEFLGLTDKQGQITHKFENVGKYILVAIKEGYKPGIAKIIIGDLRELIIKAPATVKILEPAPIRVLEESVLTVEIPVAKAAVWAISTAQVTAIDPTQDLTAMTQKIGIFLGWTDEKGYVSPTPTFNRPGKFWILAIKEGYIPAVTTISVIGPVSATAKPLPQLKSTEPITTQPQTGAKNTELTVKSATE